VTNQSLELQRATLSLLAVGGVDPRIGRGQHYLAEAVRKKFPAIRLSTDEVQQAFWSLVVQGLAFIDMAQPAAENWELKLTPAGKAAFSDEAYNPDNASGYLERLTREIPGISPTTAAYVTEAVRAYTAGLYLSATIMLGVASEAAVLQMATGLAQAGDKGLADILANPKITYNRKFQETRKRLEARKDVLPEELVDGMSLTFDSVLDLLRRNRNDAGHPSGKRFDREDCFIALQMAVRYFKKLSALNDFFTSVP
jgi:hypothetical protein